MPQSTCSVDGCTGKVLARGWCSKHYSRWNRHGDPLWEPEPTPDFRPCSIDGCDSPLKARALCSRHLEKLRRYGSPTATPPKMQKVLDALEAGELECSKCGQVLPLSGFSTDTRSARGCRPYCKACGYVMNRAWVHGNRGKVDAARRSYRSNMTDEERAKNRAITDEWKAANRDRVRDAEHRRRALRRNTRIGQIDYVTLWAESRGLCAICGQALDKATPWPEPRFASVDHIIPLSKGGTHTQDNLQYACLTCNLQKHATI